MVRRSPAAQAYIPVGTILRQTNSSPVTAAEDLLDGVFNMAPGTMVMLGHLDIYRTPEQSRSPDMAMGVDHWDATHPRLDQQIDDVVEDGALVHCRTSVTINSIP